MLQIVINNIPANKIKKALKEINTPFTARLQHELNELQSIANEEELKQYIIDQLQEYAIKANTSINGLYLQIAVGQGGMDAEDCTQNLLKMYTSFLHKYDFKYEILDVSYTAHGMSSALLKIYIQDLYIALEYETGIHRTERISPFKSKKSIQTSETYVITYPYIKTPDLTLTPNELSLTPIRSGGPGGQHANKNYTGIRAKHIPTGITVTVTRYRSQHQNRQAAISILKSRLQQLKTDDVPQQARLEDLQLIRTYDFTRDHIKSHLYNFKLQNLNSILKGNIELILLYNILYASSKSRKTN